MNEQNKPLQVEPLTYERLPQDDMWNRVNRAIGWVGVIVGSARILRGLSILLFVGSPFTAYSSSPVYRYLTAMYFGELSSSILCGCFLLIGIWGMFTKSFPGTRLIEINEWCAVILSVAMQAMSIGRLGFVVTQMPRSRAASQFVNSTASLGINCAYSVMVLWLFASEKRAKRNSG